MPLKVREVWHRLFLAERPSASLSLFRFAIAITVGCHMIPTFFHLRDNYLHTAFKEYNGSFFPIRTLELVQRSPDWVVVGFVGLFLAAWVSFLIGFSTQLSAVLMTLACYYFYALNSLHIGTLSFDILLVTLSLVWATPYFGDAFSVDSLLAKRPQPWRRLRPFFVQRLLQWQIAWTFFYTALSKVTGQGNWLTDNPYYYLMRYPAQGVVKAFPGREWLAHQPEVCKAIGLTVLAFELSLPWLLAARRTRMFGLGLGVFFHVMLLVTLHVPTIFFFLFPAQLWLFVEPERVAAWIERLRARAGQGAAASEATGSSKA